MPVIEHDDAYRAPNGDLLSGVEAAELWEAEADRLRHENAGLWRILDDQGMTPAEIKRAIRADAS